MTLREDSPSIRPQPGSRPDWTDDGEEPLQGYRCGHKDRGYNHLSFRSQRIADFQGLPGGVVRYNVFLFLPILVLHSHLMAAQTPAPISNAAAFAGSQPSEADRKTAVRDFDLLPLRFEPNQGQSSSDAKFLAHGRGFSALFKQNEADFLLAHPTGASEVLRLTLPNASSNAAISPESRLPGTVNYFNGNEPRSWHTGVPTFERLRYARVFAGTDLIYYGRQGRLEFDFQLSPGANPEAIRMRFDGAQRVSLDPLGNLIVSGKGGEISFQKPEIYQPDESNGKRLVAGSFEILDKNTIGFAVAAYDHARSLIIDPIFNYSTYIGAPLAAATAVAVDSAGEAYVTGWANLDFPTTPGSYQPVAVTTTAAGGYPAGGRIFVAKLNSSGTALVYSTYFSGSGLDSSSAIALDSNGDAFIVGTTSSKDFPITGGSLQTKNVASKSVGFVSVLNSTGSGLLYSTFLGGSTFTTVNQIAVDASGSAYVVGSTQDTDFPTTSGAFQIAPVSKAVAGSASAFVSKLNPSGAGLIYSTYLTGNGSDSALAIVIDGSGAAYVGGDTTSTNFPTSQGAFQKVSDSINKQAGFVTKLSATAAGLIYSTYLSGNSTDSVLSIAVDGTGNVYATGNTNSPDFPVTPGAYQPNIGYNGFGYPQTNAFVSVLNAAATALMYSTFLGGNSGLYLADQGDGANAIHLDGEGNAIVTGVACTIDFPITPGAFEPQNLAMQNSDQCSSFLTKLNPKANTALLYSTYLGGTGNQTPYYGDTSSSSAIDSSGNVYVVGYTVSVDFPTTASVYETPFGDTFTSGEAFLTVFNGNELQRLPIPTVTLISNTNSVVFGHPVTFTASVQSFGNRTTPTGFVGFNFLQQEISDANGSGVGMGPWTTVPVDRTGTATFTTSSLVALQTPVLAHYLGDANNSPATGSMVQQVTDLATVTTITANPYNAPYGTNITFTITVLDQNGNPIKNGINSVLSGWGSGAGWVSLDSNGRGTWSTSSLPLGTTSVYAEYTGSTGYLTSKGTVNVTLTALGITPNPTFTPPAGTYTATQQVTLNDSIAGTVMYYTLDGSTPVPGTSSEYLPGFGTIPVNASETITAVAVAPGYTSSNVVSAAYAINLPPPSFTISVSPTSLVVHSAQQGSVTLSITPQNGFNSAVSFACSGLAAGASCAFSPATVTPLGVAATTTLTITAQTLTGQLRWDGRAIFKGTTLGLAVCLLSWRRRRDLRLMLLVSAALVGLAWISACGGGNGGGSGGGSTTPATSTVTITATSGSMQQTATVALTVD